MYGKGERFALGIIGRPVNYIHNEERYAGVPSLGTKHAEIVVISGGITPAGGVSLVGGAKRTGVRTVTPIRFPAESVFMIPHSVTFTPFSVGVDLQEIVPNWVRYASSKTD